jgi:hypothetical protein
MELAKLGIIEVIKPTPLSRTSDEIRLNIDKVLEHAPTKRFITPQILRRVTKLESPQEPEVSPEPVPPLPPEAVAEVPAVESTNAKPATPDIPISARVRKAMEREPEPISGYNGEPGPSTFLAHRRVRRGAKHRH